MNASYGCLKAPDSCTLKQLINTVGYLNPYRMASHCQTAQLFKAQGICFYISIQKVRAMWASVPTQIIPVQAVQKVCGGFCPVCVPMSHHLVLQQQQMPTDAP